MGDVNLNKDVNLFEHQGIKDYSHLEYKANKYDGGSNLPYSNGFDKSKFQYEKQKSKLKDNQFQ